MENKNKEKKGFWASIAIKKNIITGLFMVMPIVLSISVFVFLFNFFVNIFRVDQITEILLAGRGATNHIIKDEITTKLDGSFTVKLMRSYASILLG